MAGESIFDGVSGGYAGAMTRLSKEGAVSPFLHHLLILLPVACLLPFVNKAFHIDDPVYLWVAQQIHTHPFDFYGFEKNWSFFSEPMYEINKNPPGVSYFIAFAALVVGWSEPALHFAFLLPMAALCYGVHYLATQLCERTYVASLAALLSPVVLVSSSNVMSDTLMLALFVWAVGLWIRGLEKNAPTYLAGAMGLSVLAALTKYPALCLLPLLFAFSLADRRRVGSWAAYFLIPLIALGLYQFVSYKLYGMNLLRDAVSFAQSHEIDPNQESLPPGARVIVGLSFLGGCHAAAYFVAPLCCSKRALCWIVLSGVIVFGLPIVFGSNFLELIFHDSYFPASFSVVQCGLFVVGGVLIIYLATSDLWRRRNASSLLLFLWVAGIFTFSTFVNWTINGRSMLPMAPAVGILLARRIETAGRPLSNMPAVAALALAGCLALLVTWADYSLADAGRRVGRSLEERLPQMTGGAVWVQGNWGPRWYLEEAGALPFDAREPTIRVGDTIIQSSNNLIFPLDAALVRSMDRRDFYVFPWLTTMDRSLGAGFYSNAWGPLPYAFGPVPPESYHSFVVDPHEVEQAGNP